MIMTQAEIDKPGRPYRCTQDTVHLGLLCPDIEPIPSVYLVRVAGATAVKTARAQEGRVMRFIGRALLVAGSVYFLIHILIWAVKP
jgi:hypothetical protein